ncbi:hypothetical protein PIB30_002315 [Stylosanthes scabra]|uniref:Uncharacterized protein n=1 Tax=Stylosanthes scabra TaxID=79078 RepID=A0ABU6U3S9_9FABA|nr:hypothetical protein [Stylosanthes scabra]
MEIDDIESLRCNETKKQEENTKQLFQICMEGRWDEVVEIYNKDKRTHTERITRSGGDSALHLAVTDGQEDVVSQLVELIVRENKEALRIQNKRKNTALHLAASMGTNNMVRVIAHADPSLVSVRNVDGETPLFLAAFHGRKEAFMILHFVSLQLGTPINYSNCRRNDGDTILHSTIASDNFELAFQIVQLYGDLVNWVNERGATPLHLLATKASAFKKSGSRLGPIETFIYHGIPVLELKFETDYYLPQSERERTIGRYPVPVNYQECMHFMTLVRKIASVGMQFGSLSFSLLEETTYFWKII